MVIVTSVPLIKNLSGSLAYLLAFWIFPINLVRNFSFASRFSSVISTRITSFRVLICSMNSLLKIFETVARQVFDESKYLRTRFLKFSENRYAIGINMVWCAYHFILLSNIYHLNTNPKITKNNLLNFTDLNYEKNS